MFPARLEYIWLDGKGELRSKTRILRVREISELSTLGSAAQWSFDGSSTGQAQGHTSDCLLQPVAINRDPFLEAYEGWLVLCEVLNPDRTPHASNTRVRLKKLAEQHRGQKSLVGIEQEYTLFENGRPLGWPATKEPPPQGPYYCGVGSDRAFGREIVEDHLDLCLVAGISLDGINAEVMPGQWEFQTRAANPLQIADELWIARWLLHRTAEEYSRKNKTRVTISFSPKPVPGDWNGAGAHINFSTKAMRQEGGLQVIEEICERLRKRHNDHINAYGDGNEDRLTGKHETCNINEFRSGVSDRGASIRIPISTAQAGCGYFEDRRPAANMDPYKALAVMLETVCGAYML
jgi:glutamine synthetase